MITCIMPLLVLCHCCVTHTALVWAISKTSHFWNYTGKQFYHEITDWRRKQKLVDVSLGALDRAYLAGVWHWFSVVCWTHEHLQEQHFMLKLLSPVECKTKASHADVSRQGFPAHSTITSQGKRVNLWFLNITKLWEEHGENRTMRNYSQFSFHKYRDRTKENKSC